MSQGDSARLALLWPTATAKRTSHLPAASDKQRLLDLDDKR